jgi:hypothetical protein
MLIKLNDEYISGSVFALKRNKLTAYYSGIINEKFDYLTKGINAAFYHYLINWGKNNNFNLIDFGGCRAFLNDGLFRYKRKWGTKIVRTENTYVDIFAFRPSINSKVIHNFLINNPFIFIDNNQYNGMIFIDKTNPPLIKEIQHLSTIDKIPGLKKLIKISPEDFMKRKK